MYTFLSYTTGLVYKNAVKPLLFRISPDTVHEKLILLGQKVQRRKSMLWLLRKSFAYQHESLTQTVCGINFNNPVGLSAGFDKNFQLPSLLKNIGFGFMEGGSLTHQPYAGNPRPWFYRLPKTKSLIVYAGLANQGVEKIIKRITSYPTSLFDDFPLNVSIAKTNSKDASSEAKAINDYIQSVRRINAENIGAFITINISCPNTYGGEPFTTPKKLSKLLAAIDKERISKPLFVKMPIDISWKEFDGLLQVIQLHSVAGVTIGNLAKDRTKVIFKEALPDNIKGNLSGKPTWDLSNELIKKTYQNYKERFVIIGVGGIFSAEDAYTKIKLGATLVELITGMIFEGPQVIGQINSGLVSLLKRDGYTSIKQAIGASHQDY